MTVAQGGRLTAAHEGVARLLTPNFDGIPEELRSKLGWGVWKAEPRPNGKVSKAPRSCATGGNIPSNDPSQRGTYAEAREAYQRGGFSGIGVFADRATTIVGIDIDNVKELVKEGEALKLWIEDYLVAGGYLEQSPSGKGLRAFVKGKMAVSARRHGGLEIYADRQFLTVTGRGKGQLINGQRHIDAFLALIEYLAAGRKPVERSKVIPLHGRSDSSKTDAIAPRMIDEIDIAMRARTPELARGDWA